MISMPLTSGSSMTWPKSMSIEPSVDVTVKDCPTAAGQVMASGTVVNSATESRDLSILVSWVAPDSASTLLQLQQTLTDVPAGETRDWSVSGSLQTDAGKCFVGARSGSLAGG